MSGEAPPVGWCRRPVLRTCTSGLAAPVLPDQETVAVESPVALVFNGISHVVMMATPLNLAELGLGFALSEGLLDEAGQCHGIEVVRTPPGWEVRMTIATRCMVRLQAMRRQMAGRTGCGVCGIESLSQLAQGPGRPPNWAPPAWLEAWQAASEQAHGALQAALKDLPAWQPMNAVTGAMHAAAWVTPAGQLAHVFEDVGRHNALDKLLGHLAHTETAMDAGWVLMSSRASHELVHKCIRAGAPLLATVSAPTSLAIDAARNGGLRLWAWCREGRFSVFA